MSFRHCFFLSALNYWLYNITPDYFYLPRCELSDTNRLLMLNDIYSSPPRFPIITHPWVSGRGTLLCGRWWEAEETLWLCVGHSASALWSHIYGTTRVKVHVSMKYIISFRKKRNLWGNTYQPSGKLHMLKNQRIHLFKAVDLWRLQNIQSRQHLKA